METQVTTADLTAEGQRVLGVWNRLCAKIDAKAWGAGLFYGDGPPALSRDPHATRVVNPYCYFPFLWQEAFPQVTRQQMRDLAERVLGYACAEREAKTILQTHVKNLRRKLAEDAQAPRFIHCVRGAGYRFAPDGAG